MLGSRDESPQSCAKTEGLDRVRGGVADLKGSQEGSTRQCTDKSRQHCPSLQSALRVFTYKQPVYPRR